MIEYVEGESV